MCGWGERPFFEGRRPRHPPSSSKGPPRSGTDRKTRRRTEETGDAQTHPPEAGLALGFARKNLNVPAQELFRAKSARLLSPRFGRPPKREIYTRPRSTCSPRFFYEFFIRISFHGGSHPRRDLYSAFFFRFPAPKQSRSVFGFFRGGEKTNRRQKPRGVAATLERQTTDRDPEQ